MARPRSGASRLYRDENKKSRRRRAAVGLLGTITALLSAVIGVVPARAGTYVMRNCDVPGHRHSPMHPWFALDTPAVIDSEISVVDACATGGGVAFTLGEPRQIRSGRNAYLVIQKPSGPRGQVKFVKVVLWYAARLTGSGQPINFLTHSYLPDGSVANGVSNPPPGSENLVAEQQLNPDVTYYYVGIFCGPLGGGVQTLDPCVAADSVPLQIRGMEVTLSEDIPPVVLQPSGNLLDGGTQSGMRTLTYSTSDPQSGLSKVDVLLDETVVASRDLTPRCSYSDFTVCPASLDENLQIDTRAVPNGPHRLTIRVQDAAGNVRTVQGASTVDVANEPDPGNGPSYAVTAHFKGTKRSTLTVSYARPVAIRGRLSQGSQPPAKGAPIEVLEKLDRRGAPEASTARVETNADGSFSARLATTRPSRMLRVAYRPNGGEQIVSRALRLRVRAASRLRATLRGRVVHFSGRVLSGPIGRRGKRVLMEGRSPGSAWTQFESFRTDRSGRFSGTYRLRVRRPGVVLKIRAAVPSEDGYGYVSSRSRVVSLRVR